MCYAILEQIKAIGGRVIILSQDNYYRGLTEEELANVEQ